MKSTQETVEQLAERDYEWGFVSDIDADSMGANTSNSFYKYLTHCVTLLHTRLLLDPPNPIELDNA